MQALSTRTRTRDAWCALAVTLLALLVRVAYAHAAAREPLTSALVGDERTFDPWARRLAAGERDVGVAFQAPGAAWSLALAYATCGDGALVGRLWNAALGALAAGLLALVAARRFGTAVGAASGLAWALYAPAIFHGSRLEKPAPAVLATAAVLLAVQSLGRAPATRGSAPPRLAAGATLVALAGLGLGSRAVAGVALAALLAVVARTGDGSGAGGAGAPPRSTLLRAGVAGACLALAATVSEPSWILLPWAVAAALRAGGARAFVALAVGLSVGVAPSVARNAWAGAPPFATTGNLGPNLAIGNHAGADGLYAPLVPGRGLAGLEQVDARELAERAQGGPLSDAEVSAYWRDRALAWIVAHPLDAATLALRKARLALSDREWMDALDSRAAARAVPWLGWLGSLARFGVLLPLALLGLALGAGGAPARRDLLWPAASLWLVLAAFFVLGRLRLPLALMLVPFAAAAPGAVLEHARARSGVRTWARAAAALLAGALLAWWPSGVRDGAALAASWNNVALAQREAGDLAAALASLRSASEADAADANVAFQHGEVAALAGLADEARAALARAARLEPAFAAEAEVVLAELALDEGDVGGAAGHLARAAARPFDRPEVALRAGIAHRRAGDLEGARRAYARALELRPAYPAAANNLGWASELLGDRAAARAAYERALAADPGFLDSTFNLARLLATAPEDGLRDGARALALAEGLAGRAGAGEADVLDLRALALAELGRFPEAVSAGEAAARAAATAGREAFAREIAGRVALYRRERSVRTPSGGN